MNLSFLANSFYDGLIERVDNLESGASHGGGLPALANRVAALEEAETVINASITTINNNIATIVSNHDDLQGIVSENSLSIAALETWRGDKAAGITKLNANAGLFGVTILGISVGTSGGVIQVANKVDEIINKLEEREITEYQT